MTANEFKNWAAKTASSRTCWTVDEITRHNQGTYLIYRGGTAGNFIEIDKTGLLELGTYEDAIPHIGDAMFRVTFRKQFPDQDAALKRCLEVGGRNFLVDILVGAGR